MMITVVSELMSKSADAEGSRIALAAAIDMPTLASMTGPRIAEAAATDIATPADAEGARVPVVEVADMPGLLRLKG